MLPVLQIGPLAMQTPGLVLLFGLWLGLTLAEKLATRFKSNANNIYNLVFTALVAGVIGARISYAALNFEAFRSSPLSLFSLNPGLLDPVSGLFIGVFAAAAYANRKKFPLWHTLDALTPLFAVMAVAFGLAHLASGDSFGMPTEMPWAIELWGAKRHPTQIYESFLAILILGYFWLRGWPTSRLPGESFWLFLSLSGGARLLVEGFRGDSQILPNGFRLAQIAAWLILAISLWMLERRKSVT